MSATQENFKATFGALHDPDHSLSEFSPATHDQAFRPDGQEPPYNARQGVGENDDFPSPATHQNLSSSML
jgi:hypothetical protein